MATQGNIYSVKCPFCRKPITRPLGEATTTVEHGATLEFVTPCPACKIDVRFWARWIIYVEAEVDAKTA